ncbi:hypothetical protein HK096_000984 [Nowakowskiella sp. JEL0078]|nr:hypothetical protein HK096_000984 [Nowakowskiella sp. JEL0078]
MDAQYLKQSVGSVLTEALSSLVNHLTLSSPFTHEPPITAGLEYTAVETKDNLNQKLIPTQTAFTQIPSGLDPISYLAHYLLHHESVKAQLRIDKNRRDSSVAESETFAKGVKMRDDARIRLDEQIRVEVDRRAAAKLAREEVEREKTAKEEAKRIEYEEALERERVEVEAATAVGDNSSLETDGVENLVDDVGGENVVAEEALKDDDVEAAVVDPQPDGRVDGVDQEIVESADPNADGEEEVSEPLTAD